MDLGPGVSASSPSLQDFSVLRKKWSSFVACLSFGPSFAGQEPTGRNSSSPDLEGEQVQQGLEKALG